MKLRVALLYLFFAASLSGALAAGVASLPASQERPLPGEPEKLLAYARERMNQGERDARRHPEVVLEGRGALGGIQQLQESGGGEENPGCPGHRQQRGLASTGVGREHRAFNADPVLAHGARHGRSS